MNGESEVCPCCLDPPEDPRCLPCMHLLCNSCLGNLAEHGIPGNASGSQHGILSVTCPICTTKFQAEYQNISRFPRAIQCRSCTKFVKAVREFRCSHVNKDICLDCVVEESGEGMSLSCPTCGASASGTVAELPWMYLCNVCHQFNRQKSCEVCYRRLLFGRFEARERQKREMEQAQRNAEQKKKQNRERELWRNERNGSKILFFLIFFVVLAAFFYGETVKDMWNEEPASHRYKGRDTNSEEQAYRNGHSSRSTKKVKTHTQRRKESKTSKEPQYIESIYIKTSKEPQYIEPIYIKREPIYIKDCYDLVTPEGKKYDRKCEKLFAGYRTVKERIPPGG